MTKETAYAREPKPPTRTPVLAPSKPLGRVRRGLRALLLWLVQLIQGHPAWPYPLAQFFALEDRPNRVYVWTVHPELTEQDAASIASSFVDEFIAKYGREPRALHIVTPDVDVIKRVTADDAKEWLAPYLQREEGVS